MRTLGLSFGLLLTGILSAQTPVVHGTTGSVVHPASPAGLPGVQRITPSVVNPGGGGVHLIVPGQARRTGTAGAYRGSPVIGYPVYIGGYYDTPYIGGSAPADAQAAQPAVMMAPQAEPTPVPVIINNFYPGASTDRQNAPAPLQVQGADVPADQPATYLIAYKDHTIYAAVAYWVEGDTLHYFTAGNTQNQVSLSLVDRDLTARLNKEAGLDVKLPAPSK